MDDLSSLSISREPVARAPRRWRTAAAAGVAVVLVVGAAATLLARDRAIDVSVGTAALRGGAGAGGGLTANGYVVARTKASVSSKVPGRLAFLGVQEGDEVTAGQVVGRLEAAEYVAAVRQAQAQVLAGEADQIETEAAAAQAARALTRARTLAADSLISPRELEDAETADEVTRARLRSAAARVAAAQQGLAAAQANLENTLIRAPFAGTVLRKDAEVGEVVAPSVAGGGFTRGAVVTMADLTTLEVEVDVNEAYISGISEQQPADIVLDAYPSETFPGHVRQVLPTADRQKATVLVRVIIDSRDSRILPEMGARVVFRVAEDASDTIAAQPARVFVPAAAVRNDGGETVVWVVVDERAQRRVVEAGPVSGDEREVRSGLNGGETVILDAPDDLSEGTRVRMPAND